MKGYIVKYSTGSYDNYRTHNVKVYLDRKEAERYVDKFNSLLCKIQPHLAEKYESDYTDEESWWCIYDKYNFWNAITEVHIEEIEIVDVVKKKDKSRWD